MLLLRYVLTLPFLSTFHYIVTCEELWSSQLGCDHRSQPYSLSVNNKLLHNLVNYVSLLFKM